MLLSGKPVLLGKVGCCKWEAAFPSREGGDSLKARIKVEFHIQLFRTQLEDH